jgi:hypothetical protein
LKILAQTGNILVTPSPKAEMIYIIIYFYSLGLFALFSSGDVDEVICLHFGFVGVGLAAADVDVR